MIIDKIEWRPEKRVIDLTGPDGNAFVLFCWFNVECVIEGILIQILKDGGTLTVIDIEGSEPPCSITIQDVYDRIQNVPTQNLFAILTENDDGVDADAVLQTVFFNEIIYA